MWGSTSYTTADCIYFTIQRIHIPEDEDIQLCSELNIKDIIKSLSLKKVSGFDLVIAELLVQLPNNIFEAIAKVINASIWKVAEVIMVPKPGKPQTEVASYRTISLLPILSKVLKKTVLWTNYAHNNAKKIWYQVTNLNAGNFDKVWHQGLIYKLQRLLPKVYCGFLTAYLSEWFFRAKVENGFSKLNPINAGIPQASILGPLLFLLYTSDVPTSSNYYVASFADDTALLCTGDTV